MGRTGRNKQKEAGRATSGKGMGGAMTRCQLGGARQWAGAERERERERKEQDVRWMGQEGKGQGRNTEKKCRDME